MLVAVTDHAAERYRQRVRGTLDARTEVAARVGEAWAAGRVSPGPRRGWVLLRASRSSPLRSVRDGTLIFVCIEDNPRGELVVVTVWEEGEQPAVPRRFTDALERPSRNSGA